MDADGLSELDAFFSIVRCVVIGSLGNTQRLGGNADAAPVEGCHGNLESLSFFSEQVFFRHSDIVEDKFCRRRRTDAQFIVMIAETEAFPAFFDDKGGNSLSTDVGRRYGKDNVYIGFGSIGNKNLATVQEIVIAFIDCRRFRAAGIRAGIFFGQAESAELFSFCQGNQVLFLLLLIAKGSDGIGAKLGMGRDDDAGSAIDAG